MGLKDRSAKYVRFFAYLAVIVLVNVAGITLFFRWDLTGNKIYSISKASQEVVSTLSEPLTINVFFTKNLPAPHNNTERYLHDLLQEYAIYGNQYFNYRFYDVSPDEGDIDEKAKVNQELARNYGIHPVQMQVIEEDEVKFQKAYMGLVLIHGDLIERIPAITSTDGLEYQVTTAIQKLNNKISALLRLREKIQVKLYLSSSLKIVAPYMRLNQLSDFPKQLEGIVEKLNNKNYGKLEFQYIDPAQDEDLEPVLKEHNIMKIKWPALSNGKIQPGEGAIGLVMEYGEKAVEIPLIHVIRIPLLGKHYELVDLNSMEEIVNESVESLIDINEDLGYLASHDTLKRFDASPADPMAQQDALSNFQALASRGYTIKDVDLKDGPIPESVNCLVVSRPTETFTDYELFQLDQFLMRGKNLALFLDTFKEVMPPMDRGMSFRQGPTYEPLDTGLEKLLEHYGVRIKKSYVLDENCYKQRMPERFGGGEQAIYFAPIIKNQAINHDLAFVNNIKGLIAMKISPLELDTERIKENGLTARRVFSSSDQAWEMKGRINLNPMFIRPPQSDDEKKSLPLAYVLEGEFPSYFAGKPIPEKEAKKDDSEDDSEKGKKEKEKKPADEKPDVDLSEIKDEGAFVSKGKAGKVFLIATSEILKDNMLDETGRTPNAMFVMNVLDFLNNREEIADMRSKEQLFNPLDDTAPGTKTFVKSFNIIGLPVLVVLFGLMVWFRRHSRKKRIQMMFQK
ncbi:MAG: Gldg family protein [Thermodesulfobacteriota bacterium]|nr:Gldg family protein [Thermodesulfobacteriota bacterium]